MKLNCKRFVIALFATVLLFPGRAAITDLPIRALSPNGRLAVDVGINTDKQPTYVITLDGKILVEESRMGFEGRTMFPNGIASYTISQIDDAYTLPHGKCSTYQDHCTLLSVVYDGPGTSRDMTIEFRLYNDAVAFRYIMEQGNLTIFRGEETEFNLTDMKQVLALSYSNDYTWYYYQHPWADLTNEKGYNEPLLVQRKTDDICILLTEAANFGETSACSIVRGTQEGQLRLQTISNSGTNPSDALTYPFQSSWRTLIIGTLPQIVESTVVDNLNPVCWLEDTSWIRPGRVAWNWAGEDRLNTGDINVAKRYVDLARHLGWEYVLIDEGWEGNFQLDEFVPYAQSQGVDVIVWYHNNNFPNNYSTCLSRFRALADLGVKALKIDFFDGDGQVTLQKYETLMRAAADAHLMIDFHGCTRPTGWERTYPHVMTMEAVLGGEFLLGEPHMNQADHAVNLVVGRNVIGPMDFTPTKLAQRTGSLKTHTNTSENPFTTWSYQLALWTLFESGFQCLIDCPDNIIDSPIEPVLRQVPAAWDETRCLEAEVSKYATLARRSGEDWYVATVSKQARSARLKLDFLDPDKTYTAYIYRDGVCQFDIAYERRTVTSETTLALSVRPNGGATVILTTDEHRPFMRTISYEAESVSSGTAESNTHCSGGRYKKGFTGNTRALFRSVKVDADGEYALTFYYLLPDEPRKAYIQVGSDGEKQYYNFHVRDDYDRSKGLVLGMKTVYVQLKAGTNHLLYGCDDGMAPDLDKITVTPTRQTQEIIDGITRNSICESYNERTLRLENGHIVCTASDSGVLTLFDASGHTIRTIPVCAGETRIETEKRGLVIASLNVNARAFSRKFVIK